MAKSGGGIRSKVVSNKYVPKQEPKPHGMSPEAVGQQGAALAFKRKDIYQGKGFSGGPVGPTGIPGTYNAKTQGPGSLRTVYRSGAQSQYGSSAPSAVNRAPDPSATGSRGRDILSGFGKDYRGK